MQPWIQAISSIEVWSMPRVGEFTQYSSNTRA